MFCHSTPRSQCCSPLDRQRAIEAPPICDEFVKFVIAADAIDQRQPQAPPLRAAAAAATAAADDGRGPPDATRRVCLRQIRPHLGCAPQLLGFLLPSPTQVSTPAASTTAVRIRLIGRDSAGWPQL